MGHMDDGVRQRGAASWKRAFASGYRDGQTCRRKGLVPAEDLLHSSDDYALGFQAGFFATLPQLKDNAA